MKISLIVAMSSNRAIGLDGQMPWHLSADLKRFKQITMGYPILMGRLTFESIGWPLPGRTNIIVSRNPAYRPEGCIVLDSVEAAISHGCQLADEVFVIGGSTLYEATLPIADTLYITQINYDFDGDTFFPDFDRNQWVEVQREDLVDDTKVGFTYSFLKLQKIT
ncbi:dihydrofolate reductase [Methyloglobulus sp.]|uniref:dihydrofolate reductase n=1 Tax=Methyloglobulus sp. TaxID=2518622 RepID=UPI0018220FAC|nr:dihydrofolate reductase [Methyloglobulus sp.]